MSINQPMVGGPPAPPPLTLLEVFEPLNTAQLVRVLVDVGSVYPDAVHMLVERARVRVVTSTVGQQPCVLYTGFLLC
jgi:hypothetical protein